MVGREGLSLRSSARHFEKRPGLRKRPLGTEGSNPFRSTGESVNSGHDHVASCHSNRMILNEDAMAVGIPMHAAVAHRFLTEGIAG
jgi:hypothetical protein